MAPLLEPRQRIAGEQFEPCRPNDPKWRAKHGELRADLGPMYSIVNLSYSDGLPAVQCQADGSGVATYLSGRKAVCVMSHHQSRRFSCFLFAPSEVAVRSVVPEKDRPSYMPAHVDDAKRRRTRHLGALDEWGKGVLESLPDGAGQRGSYEVTGTHVTVVTAGGAGSRVRVPRNKAEGEPLSLRLCPELAVSYNAATGTTAVDFSSGGVSYTFHIGEVWRLGRSPATNPREIHEQIALSSQNALDSSCSVLTEGTALMEKTLKNTTSCLSLSTGSGKTLKKSSSESTMRLPLEAFKQMSEGRLDFTQDHDLKKKLSSKVHPTLRKVPVSRALREGYLWPAAHPGKPPAEPLRLCEPQTLQRLSVAELQKRVASQEGGQVLAALVVASWATQSVFSSSARAEVVAQAAYSELKAGGEERLQFCVLELAEAGAIHSSTKFNNPLVTSYGVKEAPWLLLFAQGELVFSENPQGPRSGGLGFAARLRYLAFAQPQVLIVEPVANPGSMQLAAQQNALESSGGLFRAKSVVNNFQLQLQTQEVLKRAGYSFELAVTTTDALRLSACANPPYGVLLCSSQVSAGAYSELALRMRQRNPQLLAFICHDGKALGELDDALQSVVREKELAQGVIYRPITKSSFLRSLRGHPEAGVHYPTCGVVKEDLVELLKKKLNSF